MPLKKRAIRTLVVSLLIVGAAVVSGIYGFTYVPIQRAEEIMLSGEFDPAAFVEGIWENSLIPAIEEGAVDLPLVLGRIRVDENGFTSKENLIPVTKEYGLITVGEAHVYMVKGQGQVMRIDTSSSIGTLELSLDEYNGPIEVIFYIGPRIPSDESSVRDAVGFINFGDFKEQTEYGRVAAEINRRISKLVLEPLDKADLEGKRIRFYGAFMIRTFNLVRIDVNQIRIVPVNLSILSE